jgi:hypothetical protein
MGHTSLLVAQIVVSVFEGRTEQCGLQIHRRVFVKTGSVMTEE